MLTNRDGMATINTRAAIIMNMCIETGPLVLGMSLQDHVAQRLGFTSVKGPKFEVGKCPEHETTSAPKTFSNSERSMPLPDVAEKRRGVLHSLTNLFRLGHGWELVKVRRVGPGVCLDDGQTLSNSKSDHITPLGVGN